MRHSSNSGDSLSISEDSGNPALTPTDWGGFIWGGSVIRKLVNPPLERLDPYATRPCRGCKQTKKMSEYSHAGRFVTKCKQCREAA